MDPSQLFTRPGGVCSADWAAFCVCAAARCRVDRHAQAVLRCGCDGLTLTSSHLFGGSTPEESDSSDCAALTAALRLSEPRNLQLVVAADAEHPDVVWIGLCGGCGVEGYYTKCGAVEMEEEVMVHRGVAELTSEALDMLCSMLPPAEVPKRLVFCGYSVCGGVAQTLADTWCRERPEDVSAVVTFGAPAVSATPELETNTRSFVCGDDIVPRLAGSRYGSVVPEALVALGAAVGDVLQQKAFATATEASGEDRSSVEQFRHCSYCFLPLGVVVSSGLEVPHRPLVSAPSQWALLCPDYSSPIRASALAAHHVACYGSALASELRLEEGVRRAAAAAAPTPDAVQAAEREWGRWVDGGGAAGAAYAAATADSREWAASVSAELRRAHPQTVAETVAASRRDSVLQTDAMALHERGAVGAAEVGRLLAARAARRVLWMRHAVAPPNGDLLDGMLLEVLDSAIVLPSQKRLLNSALALLYNCRAGRSKSQGKLREALQDMHFAAQADPRCAEIRSNLSAVLLRCGLATEAHAHAHQAVDLILPHDETCDEDGDVSTAAAQRLFPVDTPVVMNDGLRGVVCAHARGRVGVRLPGGSCRGYIPERVRVAPKHRYPVGARVETADGAVGVVCGHRRGRVGIEFPDGQRRGLLPDSILPMDAAAGQPQSESPAEPQSGVRALVVEASCLHNYAVACSHLPQLSEEADSMRKLCRDRLGFALRRMGTHPTAVAIRASLARLPADGPAVVADAGPALHPLSPGVTPRILGVPAADPKQAASQRRAVAKPQTAEVKQRAVAKPQTAPANGRRLRGGRRAVRAAAGGPRSVLYPPEAPATGGRRLPPLALAPTGDDAAVTLPAWRPRMPETQPSPPKRRRHVVSPLRHARSRLPPDLRPKPKPWEVEAAARDKLLREARWSDDPSVTGPAPHRRWIDRETLLTDMAAKVAKRPLWSKKVALAAEGTLYKESSRRRAIEQEELRVNVWLCDRQLRNRLGSMEHEPRFVIQRQQAWQAKQLYHSMNSERVLIHGQLSLLRAVDAFASDLKREEETDLEAVRCTDARLRVLADEGVRRQGYGRFQLHEWDVLQREAAQEWLDITWVRGKLGSSAENADPD